MGAVTKGLIIECPGSTGSVDYDTGTPPTFIIVFGTNQEADGFEQKTDPACACIGIGVAHEDGTGPWVNRGAVHIYKGEPFTPGGGGSGNSTQYAFWTRDRTSTADTTGEVLGMVTGTTVDGFTVQWDSVVAGRRFMVMAVFDLEAPFAVDSYNDQTNGADHTLNIGERAGLGIIWAHGEGTTDTVHTNNIAGTIGFASTYRPDNGTTNFGWGIGEFTGSAPVWSVERFFNLDDLAITGSAFLQTWELFIGGASLGGVIEFDFASATGIRYRQYGVSIPHAWWFFNAGGDIFEAYERDINVAAGESEVADDFFYECNEWESTITFGFDPTNAMLGFSLGMSCEDFDACCGISKSSTDAWSFFVQDRSWISSWDGSADDTDVTAGTISYPDAGQVSFDKTEDGTGSDHIGALSIGRYAECFSGDIIRYNRRWV